MGLLEGKMNRRKFIKRTAAAAAVAAMSNIPGISRAVEGEMVPEKKELSDGQKGRVMSGFVNLQRRGDLAIFCHIEELRPEVLAVGIDYANVYVNQLKLILESPRIHPSDLQRVFDGAVKGTVYGTRENNFKENPDGSLVAIPRMLTILKPIYLNPNTPESVKLEMRKMFRNNKGDFDYPQIWDQETKEDVQYKAITIDQIRDFSPEEMNNLLDHENLGEYDVPSREKILRACYKIYRFYSHKGIFSKAFSSFHVTRKAAHQALLFFQSYPISISLENLLRNPIFSDEYLESVYAYGIDKDIPEFRVAAVSNLLVGDKLLDKGLSDENHKVKYFAKKTLEGKTYKKF
jgi:hypothetical protein